MGARSVMLRDGGQIRKRPQFLSIPRFRFRSRTPGFLQPVLFHFLPSLPFHSFIRSFIHSSDDPFTKVGVYQGVDAVSSKRAEGLPAPTATLCPRPSQEPTLPRHPALGEPGAWTDGWVP